MKNVLLSLLLLWPSFGSAIGSDVKVLFVYDTSGYATTSDHYALANSFVNFIELALTQSNLGTYDYDFEVHPVPVNFTASSSTPVLSILNYMRSTSSTTGSIYDLRYSYGADVVVMIVDAYTNSLGQPGGGTVAPIPSSIINPWDLFKAGYMVIADHWINSVPPGGNPAGGWPVVEGHEIGHILFAQHEPAADPNLSTPIEYNHGHVVPVSGSIDGKQTIMAAGAMSCGGNGDDCEWYAFYSDTDTNFPGSQTTAGESTYSRVQDLIPLTWPIVAAYRDPPPSSPPPPSCSVIWTGQCSISGEPELLFTVSPPTNGVPILSIDVERKIGAGIWEALGDIFDFLCLPFPGATGIQVIFKAILNSNYGTSQCIDIITLPSDACDDDINPW